MAIASGQGPALAAHQQAGTGAGIGLRVRIVETETVGGEAHLTPAADKSEALGIRLPKGFFTGARNRNRTGDLFLTIYIQGLSAVSLVSVNAVVMGISAIQRSVISALSATDSAGLVVVWS